MLALPHIEESEHTGKEVEGGGQVGSCLLHDNLLLPIHTREQHQQTITSLKVKVDIHGLTFLNSSRRGEHNLEEGDDGVDSSNEEHEQVNQDRGDMTTIDLKT